MPQPETTGCLLLPFRLWFYLKYIASCMPVYEKKYLFKERLVSNRQTERKYHKNRMIKNIERKIFKRFLQETKKIFNAKWGEYPPLILIGLNNLLI